MRFPVTIHYRIEQNWQEVWPHDHVIYKGKECPVPTFYFEWLKKHHPEMAEVVQGKRKKYYEDKDYETGLRQMQAAKARDSRTSRLRRTYEE